MSLESFIGMDSGESMSESAFEELRARMKAAQAQIAAIKKEEKKQKKKEDELLKILLKFIKTSHKTDLILLVSRALEQNIPANFILAIILLGNEEIQKEVGDFLMLSAGENIPQEGAVRQKVTSNDKALVFFSEHDETLPLKIKIKLDTWIKGLLFQAEESPQKLLKTGQTTEIIDDQEVKSPEKNLIKLFTFVVRDYLEQNDLEEPYERLESFATFILKGILSRTEENLQKRNLLGS